MIIIADNPVSDKFSKNISYTYLILLITKSWNCCKFVLWVRKLRQRDDVFALSFMPCVLWQSQGFKPLLPDSVVKLLTLPHTACPVEDFM